VFSSDKEYSDIELIGLYNKDSFNDNLIFIDDLKDYIEIKSSLKEFYTADKLILQENYANFYNKLKMNKSIKKYSVNIDNKTVCKEICFSSNKVIKKNIRRIQKSFKKKELDKYFYSKNCSAIDLVYLDFRIQNEIIKYLNSDIYFLLKEKNVFVKIKLNTEEVLLKKEENYNLPLLPMSF
jgi:hypothetical protein